MFLSALRLHLAQIRAAPVNVATLWVHVCAVGAAVCRRLYFSGVPDTLWLSQSFQHYVLLFLLFLYRSPKGGSLMETFHLGKNFQGPSFSACSPTMLWVSDYPVFLIFPQRQCINLSIFKYFSDKTIIAHILYLICQNVDWLHFCQLLTKQSHLKVRNFN